MKQKIIKTVVFFYNIKSRTAHLLLRFLTCFKGRHCVSSCYHPCFTFSKLKIVETFNERINFLCVCGILKSNWETQFNNCLFIAWCPVILEVDSCWMPGYGVRQCVHGRCVQQQQTDGTTTHNQCVCDPGYTGLFCTESEYLNFQWNL